jgi:squalene-hopene/tetraprenyl-beta-curcumene cyclase
MRRFTPSITAASLAILALTTAGLRAEGLSDAEQQQVDQMVQRAVDFLQNEARAEDGSYAEYAGPGVTAAVTTGILQHGRSADDPAVAPSLKYLEGFIQPDGGIYRPGTFLRNYETSLVLMCFVAANEDGRYDKVIERAEAFLKGLQWDENEDLTRSDTAYGGAGYGKHKRPDMSNTQFLVEALRTAGNGPDDPAIQKALVFVSRCQNLESPHNTTEFAAKINDGGFYYTIAAGGESKAGETPNGGLRSYGSMTYAGLKSMIYAGLDKDDPRAKAALEWIGKHYRLDENPGLGSNGLFYYYQVFAKTLDAAGLETVTSDGIEHDWRSDLVAELAKRQRANGSWVNDNPRWLEGEPALVTAYGLLALAHCK